MITRCVSTHRVEFNGGIGGRKKDIHSFHHKGLVRWNQAEEGRVYLMKCYKCFRLIITDESLNFQQGQRGCAHGWNCYMIQEIVKVYRIG